MKHRIALSSVALSVKRKGIQKHFLIILCQHKAYAKGFIKEMAKQRTGIVVILVPSPVPVTGSHLEENGSTQASIYHARNHLS